MIAKPAKRVLIVEANEDHTVGGSHQAMYDLVLNLDRSRFEPVVLFYQHNVYVSRLRDMAEVIVYEEVRQKEVRTNLHGTRAAKVLQLATAIRRRAALLRDERIDLVHINNSPRTGNDDWVPAARLVGVPIIANAMGDAEGESGWLRRILFSSFDHVMPISGYMHASMAGAGIDPGRLTRVDLGVDIERTRARVTQRSADVRRDLGLEQDVLLAVMVGNIRPWKGQHVVLEALQRMERSLQRRVHVAFVGATGPEYADYERELKDAVATHGLRGSVSFVGPRHDVPNLFNAADLALHASVIPEPFGLVIVEALALGTPVVAANTGGPAEILTPECGVVYDPREPLQLAQALERLAADPAYLARLRAGTAARAAEFSIARYVSGITSVYDYCTAARTGRFRRVPPRPVRSAAGAAATDRRGDVLAATAGR